ncbi:MAG TPA: hypothetical protein VK484_11455 [Ferruginibacter sp.]|nr:hypothetical protein [Ferruginibacter sp.]
MMTFEIWLKQFNKKQTAIGDLARDFKNSGCYTIKASFDKFIPCDAALETYCKARRSYVLELANLLHDELSDILEQDEADPEFWYPSLSSLHDLCDILADLDGHLRGGFDLDE